MAALLVRIGAMVLPRRTEVLEDPRAELVRRLLGEHPGSGVRLESARRHGGGSSGGFVPPRTPPVVREQC
jgi:hypothetical protein